MSNKKNLSRQTKSTFYMINAKIHQLEINLFFYQKFVGSNVKIC